MRILYDGNIYALQPTGGITRYFGSLISRLPDEVEASLVLGHKLNSTYAPDPKLNVFQFDQIRLLPFSYRLSVYYSRLRDRALRSRLARTHFDVVHPTYYSLLHDREIDSYRAPVVITVWDMIHELFPVELDPHGDFAALKKRAIESAQKIICISENTKRDLLDIYSIPESKVAVTYLASEIDESISHGSDVVPSRPYFLFVGSRARYKNFDGLLKAFARVASGLPELALCIVGPPFNEDENRRLADLGLSRHIEHYGFPDDAHLAKLYRCSVALVYPSLYEGFGLPPLEAMACGTVAVVARASSIPEVVGDAGMLFDPASEDELTDILKSLSRDETAREKLILRGRERAKQFTWEDTVKQTVSVYRAAAG